MLGIKQITDRFFAREAGVTIRDLTSSLMSGETNVPTGIVKPTSEKDFVVNGKDVYKFLSDTGNGRIYEGLKSLELMSKIIKGVGNSSVTLFDNKIIAFTPDDMKSASAEGAKTIINANLGVKDIYDFAKISNSNEIARYDEFLSRISRQVKAGGFIAEEHRIEGLVRVKALIRSIFWKNR